MSGVRQGYRRYRRISKTKDIRGILSAGKRARRGSLEVVWREKSTSLRSARAGVVITTRWRGSKPERNKLRRRYREALRKLIPEMRPGLEVLVNLKIQGRQAEKAGKAGSTLERLRGIMARSGLLLERND